MLQHYFRVENLDGQYWTMTIELLFYGYVFILLLFRQIGEIERYSTIILALSALYCFPFFNSLLPFHKLKMSLLILPYFPLFFAGILFYKLKFEAITKKRIVLLFTTFIIQAFLFHTCYKNNTLVSFTIYLSALSALYLVFTLILYNKLAFIINDITIWFGKISYSLYLIHGYLGRSILIPYFHETLRLPFGTTVGITLIIVIGIAFCLHQFIEVPSMNYIRHRITR